RVAEIKERALDQDNSGSLEGGPRCLLVIDHQSEMATIVRGLLAAFLKSNELVAQIDKGHRIALAAQLELEEAAVERQRLLDVSHFQRYVVEADDARLCRLSHQIRLLCARGLGGDGLFLVQPQPERRR